MGPVLVMVVVAATAAVAPSSGPPERPVEYPEPAPDGDWQGTADCILGHWYLDVEDYEAQSEVFLKNLGVPIDDLELAGTIRISVYLEGTPDPNLIEVSSSLVATATVMGNTVSASNEYLGNGQWFMAPQPGDPDIENTSNFVEVDHWLWGVEPPGQATDAAAVPPLIDPTVGAQFNCDGDLLTVHGPDAPLIGHFRRGDAPQQSALPATTG